MQTQSHKIINIEKGWNSIMILAAFTAKISISCREILKRSLCMEMAVSALWCWTDGEGCF